MAGEGNRNKPETVWLEIAAGLEFYENGNDEAALKIELRDSDFHKGLREGDVVRFSALIHRRDELVAHQKEPACVQDASLLEVDEETGFDVKFTKIQKIEASE